MAAPIGIATTNTNASFVFQNMQVILDSTVAGNANSAIAIPNIQALSLQNAMFMSGRQPGGAAYRKPSNVVFTSPSNANAAIVQLDNMTTASSVLGYTKNGAFLVQTNGTAVVVPLTNTQTNTNSFAGDTTFATINQAILYNLSGLDGNALVDGVFLTNGTNGCNFIGATGLTLKGASRVIVENNNGVTVNAANLNISINSATAANIAVVLMGA